MTKKLPDKIECCGDCPYLDRVSIPKVIDDHVEWFTFYCSLSPCYEKVTSLNNMLGCCPLPDAEE